MQYIRQAYKNYFFFFQWSPNVAAGDVICMKTIKNVGLKKQTKKQTENFTNMNSLSETNDVHQSIRATVTKRLKENWSLNLVMCILIRSGLF